MTKFTGYRLFRNNKEIGFYNNYNQAKLTAIIWKNKYPDSKIEIRFHSHRYEIIKGQRIKWRIIQLY